MNVDDIDYLTNDQRNFSMVRLCHDFEVLTCTQHKEFGLNAYVIGNFSNPLIVLVAPIGSSFLLMAPLAKYLSKKFYVVVCEVLVTPYRDQPEADLSLLANELHQLLECLERQPQAIVSFCSACNIILRFLENSAVRPTQLIVISPLINSGVERDRTLYEQQIMPLWSRIEHEGDAFVQMFLHLVNQSSTCGNDLDAELESLNRLVLRDTDSTKTYARMLCSAMRFDSQAAFRNIDIPVTIFHAEDDGMVHWQESALLADLSDKISQDICKEGGHFFLFKDEKLHLKILSTLLEREKFTCAEVVA